MTQTYYEVVHHETGLPTPAQARKLGTPAYGFRTIARARRYCPAGYCVQERFNDGRQDWIGNIVAGEGVQS